MRKKLLKIVLLVCCVLGCFVAGGLYYQQKFLTDLIQSKLSEPEKPTWLTDVAYPETIKPGAYLAALNAVVAEDLEQAAHFYAKTLSGDPKNPKLQQESYFFNAILGNLDDLREVVRKMPAEKKATLYTDYVRAGYALKDGRWADVRQELSSAKMLPVDEIVYPLIIAWSYVGEGRYEEAMKALDPLKKQQGLESYYNYHKGLMALALGKDFEADAAFQQLAQSKLLTLSLYPEIQAFYVQKSAWTLENPFYVQWRLFSAEQPATAELIILPKYRPVTAIRGAAEAFYNISTAMGGSKQGFEGALILSALSLYLNPDQELPKIWSAELLEQNNKPQLAAHYYKKLNMPLTQTISFKKANNLILCGREAEALPILLELKKTNRESVPLWFALAHIYQSQKQWPEALKAYTNIIEKAKEVTPEYLSDIYFARAFIYTELKQAKLAESDLIKALDLNPKNPLLLNHLGYQWLEKDETLHKGMDLVKKAYELNKKDPHIIDSMAYAYYRTADYAQALPLAEKTVDIMPQSSVANAHLGDIYNALGRHREALFQYQKALVGKYDLTPELKAELLVKIKNR